MYVKGESLKMEIEDPDNVGTYVLVGKATANDWSDDLNLLEANNKGNGGFKEYLADDIELTTSLTVQMFKGEAGQAILIEAAKPTNRKTPVKIKLDDTVTVIAGSFFIRSRGRSGSNNEIATMNVSLTATGTWTETDVA
jgi:hypothetical protein